jgi:hypothetical protein
MSTLDTGYNDDPVCAAIHAAEEVRDPLEGIVERTGTNPGAAFAPEVLERLAALKRHDRAAFEAVRAQLKNAGCRVTALDDAVSKESAEAGGRSPKQADILIGLAQTAELFRTPDGTGFADLDINSTVKPGRSAPRVSGAGLRAVSSRRRAARRVRKLCNRR